ncbi:MAG TPA: hypothetical protein DDW50_01120 [Firmicutes bacterium]|jgi:hypothetical protein|nr:hypothetical protein [Bacillota bacterium]
MSKIYLKVIFAALFITIFFLIAYCADDSAYYGYFYAGESNCTLFKLEMINDKVNFFTLPDSAIKRSENIENLLKIYDKENLSKRDFAVVRETFNTEKTIRLVVDKISRSKTKISLITKPQKTVYSDVIKVTFTGTINGSKIKSHVKIDHIDEKDSWPDENDMELQQIK